MTLQERKDKADIIAKEADIVHKKMIPLLATAEKKGEKRVSGTLLSKKDNNNQRDLSGEY